MRLLIAGGAGFIGSNLALLFKSEHPNFEVVVLDNLRRRGGEYNLPVFRRAGIEFIHGDIRVPSDLDNLEGHFDLLIEASAEPSVLAGLGNSGPSYVFETNMNGALNCLEFTRKRAGAFIFLSTSRVYSIDALSGIRLQEGATRFEIAKEQTQPGVSARGISEEFSTTTARSFYGASKLAAEMLVQEYAEVYEFPAVINRCGIVAGPGQWGKTDQGVLTFWMARHFFGQPLRYTGFGGLGKQVRDMLHPRDLYKLLELQIAGFTSGCPTPYNAGGGLEFSSSLLEWTGHCQVASGQQVPVTSEPESSSVDVPLYVSDYARVKAKYGWEPTISPRKLAEDIAAWLRANEPELRDIFAPER